MYQNQLNFCNFRIENFKMIKQNRKLLLTAKYKLINFGKKKNKQKKKTFLITEKKLCGPLSMGQSGKGETKTILFLA